MKEITAIIRRDKLVATRRALERVFCPAITIYSVEGRGKQGGRMLSEIDPEIPDSYEAASRILTHSTPSVYALEHQINKPVFYIPKRMLWIVVPDHMVAPVVGAIIAVNQTGAHGDGKIFVAPVEGAWQVRTAQTGEQVAQ
jgi:nitrogen regulatory protein PII 2